MAIRSVWPKTGCVALLLPPSMYDAKHINVMSILKNDNNCGWAHTLYISASAPNYLCANHYVIGVIFWLCSLDLKVSDIIIADL